MITRIIAIFSVLALTTTALAADNTEKPFVKKRYSIMGTAKIETVDGQNRLVFSAGFKTKNGPDLKVFLSKLPIESLSVEDVAENTVRLSVLKSNKGGQTYIIPAEISLDEYESVILHCEYYGVLWGGFDL